MSDLRERVADLVFEYPVKKADRGVTSYEMADDILALVEPAIRADERAKVRAEATSGEAVERATDLVRRELDRIEAVMTDPITLQRHMARRCARAAILAALGDEP